MVVGIGANAGGAVGNGIGVVTIVGEGAGFKGVRVGTGVVVGSGVDDSAAVGRGVRAEVTVGAEVDTGAGPSVAAGSRLSQAMPTVTASDRTSAMRIAREGSVMEGITMRPGGYQTRKSEEAEYLCWIYFGRRHPELDRTAPTFLPASLGNAPWRHRLTDNKMGILSD